MNGEHIALVPTMGNLHTGHASRSSSAPEGARGTGCRHRVRQSDAVWCDGEDFDDYPRTLDRDKRKRLKARLPT